MLYVDNETCSPSGHHLGYYPGSPFQSQVITTQIRNPVSSAITKCRYTHLLRMRGYKDSSPCALAARNIPYSKECIIIWYSYCYSRTLFGPSYTDGRTCSGHARKNESVLVTYSPMWPQRRFVRLQTGTVVPPFGGWEHWMHDSPSRFIW